jgi:transcriptional regulator with XRE-family HTH domain
MLSYSRRLQAAMQAAKLNQPALAKLAGISTQAVNKVINEQSRGFSALVQSRVCQALGISERWLATGEGPMAATAAPAPPAVEQPVAKYSVTAAVAPIRPDEVELLTLFRDLRAEDQSWVLNTVRRFRANVSNEPPRLFGTHIPPTMTFHKRSL